MNFTETSSNAEQLEALKNLASLALGKSGADIQRLVKQARQGARRQRRPLHWQDLEREISGCLQPFTSEVQWAIAVHEAGHALAYILLDVAAVHSARIGLTERGSVRFSYRRDHLETEEFLMKTIACSLAGRAAEKLLLGHVTLGAGGSDDSDLSVATKAATGAELAFGIGAEWPLLYRNELEQSRLLSVDPRLMARVHERLDKAEQMALDLLRENIRKLEALAERLNEVRVLEEAEIISVIRQACDTR